MREDRNGMERLIVDAGWVELPDDLRDRVLAAAAAVVRESHGAGWLDRVWYSTAWRVAAAVTLLVICLLNSIPASTHEDVGDSYARAAYEAAQDGYYLARQLGFPDEDCRRLGGAALVASLRSVRREALAGKE